MSKIALLAALVATALGTSAMAQPMVNGAGSNQTGDNVGMNGVNGTDNGSAARAPAASAGTKQMTGGAASQTGTGGASTAQTGQGQNQNGSTTGSGNANSRR